MIRKLVYSLSIILICFSCSKTEQKYDNPIFAHFFKELNNKSIDEFNKSYYPDKSKEVLDVYIPILKDLKNSNFTITSYHKYSGKKLNFDGDTKNIYIVEIDKEILTTFKIEDNKIQYLIPICKGNEIIGWI
ncbi:hypothetical protein [Chryseobacterium sp. JUb7]|uniref:hypothetical protein n=1 Tax=Chryseobacterium sp. JUb7 TaxID=2940599 RepID=UPI00216A2F18|nr:hypothetical protein [Chryseobacterium sp. JUb7]MCS3533063.1 hypothetical protein [Chryseobacterium sp. JUb7]